MIKNAVGQTLLVDGSITRIHEKENEADGFLITLRDITEIKRMSETIDYQASHDNLTGLSNREEFSFMLNELLASLRTSDARHALLVIDIDRFKAINDTCGSMAGDELLRQIASHVQANISRKDISARIGGDEFAIIFATATPRTPSTSPSASRPRSRPASSLGRPRSSPSPSPSGSFRCRKRARIPIRSSPPPTTLATSPRRKAATGSTSSRPRTPSIRSAAATWSG